MNQRLMLYRARGGRADATASSTGVVEEIEDRYGPLPESVLNLADYGRIRIMADRLGIETIDREGRSSSLRSRGRPGRRLRTRRAWSALVREHPDVTLVPPSGLKLDLKWKAKVGGPRHACRVRGRSRQSRRRRPWAPKPQPIARRRRLACQARFGPAPASARASARTRRPGGRPAPRKRR